MLTTRHPDAPVVPESLTDDAALAWASRFLALTGLLPQWPAPDAHGPSCWELERAQHATRRALAYPPGPVGRYDLRSVAEMFAPRFPLPSVPPPVETAPAAPAAPAPVPPAAPPPREAEPPRRGIIRNGPRWQPPSERKRAAAQSKRRSPSRERNRK